MKIFPAIDIIGGNAVRLVKGDYNAVKKYSNSPVSVAKEFAEKGAKCLHLVDLDGAKSGETENYSTVENIVKSTSAFVEIGGGVRDRNRVEKYLNAGVKRVILGTSAVKNPDFRREAVKAYGEAIAVGVDVKNGFVATDGWLQVSELNGVDFVKKLRDEGVKTVIFTDISRDGMMKGTNLKVYEELSKIEGVDIVASGGVTALEEIETLRSYGLYGAILGKALYENKIDLTEALSVARGGKE